MAETAVEGARAPSSIDDSLYGSFERVHAACEPTRRALAGLRNADEWVELTYDELMDEVVRVSTSLSALGLEPGDVLCLQLPNWTEAVIYTYAASRLGVVVCPITTIYRQRELRFILERTRCKVLVCPSTYRGFDYAAMTREISEELTDLRHVVCVGASDTVGVLSSEALRWPEGPAAPSTPVSMEDLAVLAFTSGTTGESKGVMHSHASMHAAIDDFVSHAGFGRGLTSLVMSPFGHLTGFTWGILMPLRGAGNVVLLESWDPQRALDLVAQYSVTFTMGATPFLTDLLDLAARRPGTRFPDVFVCAGAPIPPILIERAVSRHNSRVVSGWGMSEYPIGTSTAVSDDPLLASTTDGRPAGRAEVLILGEDGTPVDVGGEGDVVIRGPGLFRGYYKRPDLDAEAFTARGFLKTGDRARLQDRAGHLRISGRTKDIIIRGGENIPVVEVENLLLTHPAVKEVALIPIPHERLGETACACIVHQADVTEHLSVQAIGRFLDEKGVAKQFWPEAVRIMTELPRTPSGKIQKFVLRDRLVETPSGAR